jgi:hypothetical protein
MFSESEEFIRLRNFPPVMELRVLLKYSEYSYITPHAEIAESDSSCTCTLMYFFMIHFNTTCPLRFPNSVLP